MSLLFFLFKQKTAYEMRISDWSSDVCSSDLGARGAELIGQWLKRHKLPVDRIIASPAVRVTETLDIFQPAAGLDALEPHWDRRIYLASAAPLIAVLRDTGRDAGHLLISGHNPGLEYLILLLVPETAGHDPRAQSEDKT